MFDILSFLLFWIQLYIFATYSFEFNTHMYTLRKFLHAAFLVAAVSVLFGCTESDPTYRSQLTLSENSVAFDSGGGIKSIEVKPFPENELWEASCSEAEDWFSFEVSDNSLTVTVDPNHSVESRSGHLTLTSPQGNFDPYEVAVLQEGAAPLEFSTTASDCSFDSEGGEIIFSVVSNYGWTVEYDVDWLTVIHEVASGRMIVLCKPNESEEQRSAILTMSFGAGDQEQVRDIVVTQGTRAQNPYLKYIGKWEITAAKWYYSPNGSLNSLDYNPDPNDNCLIFDIEEGEYGKTFIMKDFLYPDTSLEIRYDKESGNIVIPFGWTVYSYDTYLYVTLVGSSKFSYASLEVDGIPSEDFSTIDLDLPEVEGFNYVGFGLWTYNDNGDKVALGSRYRPTVFPMAPVVFKKQSIKTDVR